MRNKMKNNSISFFSLLGIVFIVLKLTDFIDWSWWLVLLPLYGGIVLFILFALIYVYFRMKKHSELVEQEKRVQQKPIKSRFQQRLHEMEKQKKNI